MLDTEVSADAVHQRRRLEPPQIGSDECQRCVTRSQQQHPGKVQVGYLFPTFDRFGVYYRKGDSIGGKIAAAVTALRANGTLKRLAAKYKIPVGDVK